MVSTQRRSRSSRSEVASRLLIARMPVSGVRTSWAKAASAASTMPALGARRLARGRALRALRRAVEMRFFFGGAFWPAALCAVRAILPPCSPTRAEPAWHATAAEVTEGLCGNRPVELRQADQAADIGRRRARGAQLAQARSPGSISTASARRHRGSAGDAGRPVAAIPSSACSSRCTLVDQNRSCPRTTSVTPCRASSITTDR